MRIFELPTTEIRRMLERMMNLNPNQILRVRKPASGDAGAPRRWHDLAQRSMQDLSFETRVLEPCLFLSYGGCEQG